MTAPTAEERARLRELAGERSPRRIGICEEHWHLHRIAEFRVGVIALLDALDAAERLYANDMEHFAREVRLRGEDRERIAALKKVAAYAEHRNRDICSPILCTCGLEVARKEAGL